MCWRGNLNRWGTEVEVELRKCWAGPWIRKEIQSLSGFEWKIQIRNFTFVTRNEERKAQEIFGGIGRTLSYSSIALLTARQSGCLRVVWRMWVRTSGRKLIQQTASILHFTSSVVLFSGLNSVCWEIVCTVLYFAFTCFAWITLVGWWSGSCWSSSCVPIQFNAKCSFDNFCLPACIVHCLHVCIACVSCGYFKRIVIEYYSVHMCNYRMRYMTWTPTLVSKFN